VEWKLMKEFIILWSIYALGSAIHMAQGPLWSRSSDTGMMLWLPVGKEDLAIIFFHEWHL